jgi:hypothetical protein
MINLLTGAVLIDGNPPAGLPRSVRENPLYVRTFGETCNFQVTRLDSGVMVTTKPVDGRYMYEFFEWHQGQLVVTEVDMDHGWRFELLDSLRAME